MNLDQIPLFANAPARSRGANPGGRAERHFHTGVWQVKSPKSGRLIMVGSPAFQKLEEDGCADRAIGTPGPPQSLPETPCTEACTLCRYVLVDQRLVHCSELERRAAVAHRDAVASHRRRTGSVKVRSGRAHAPSTIARSTLLHPLAHFPKRFAPWYGQQQQR
jgi:hypothetical protein